jgi:hypothetical protein
MQTSCPFNSNDMRRDFTVWKNIHVNDVVVLFSATKGYNLWDRKRGIIVNIFKKDKLARKGPIYALVNIENDNNILNKDLVALFHIKYPKWKKIYNDFDWNNYIVWPVSNLHKKMK